MVAGGLPSPPPHSVPPSPVLVSARSHIYVQLERLSTFQSLAPHRLLSPFCSLLTLFHDVPLSWSFTLTRAAVMNIYKVSQRSRERLQRNKVRERDPLRGVRLTPHECARVLSHFESCPTLRLHGQYPARLLCPWNSPVKNTGVDCHALPQGIFPVSLASPALQAGSFPLVPPRTPTHPLEGQKAGRTPSPWGWLKSACGVHPQGCRAGTGCQCGALTHSGSLRVLTMEPWGQEAGS